MPIEIKELNIRINVNQNQAEQGDTSSKDGAQSQPMPEKDELIAECIEQVMELLKNKHER